MNNLPPPTTAKDKWGQDSRRELLAAANAGHYFQPSSPWTLRWMKMGLWT